MSMTLEESRHQLLHSAAQLARRSPGEPVERLLHRYYRHVVTEDLLARRPEDLLGAALSHRALAAQRPVGSVNVRVFTPTVEQEGWTTGHTVVEIVTDDMPFLVDSVSAYLARGGRSVHMLVHPQLVVRRDAAGALAEVLDVDPQDAPQEFGVGTESWMHLQIDRESDAAAREALADGLRRVLGDVRVAVEDWPRMTEKAREIAAALQQQPPAGVPAEEVAQAENLLRWLADGQFTFLGYREYTLSPEGDAARIEPVQGSGLGLMRYDVNSGGAFNVLTGAGAEKAREKTLLVITKANSISTVHRPAYLDYVGVKSFDAAGEVVGERRFIGLFAAGAYNHSVTRVPFVSEKVKKVIAASGFAPDSHLAKDLLGVLETYPRDELFQSDVDDLTKTAMSVVHLHERRQPRLFLRRDQYGRFMSCLVYIPRDRYNTTVRLRLEAILKKAFHGESVEYTTRVSESALARLHFVVRVAAGDSLPDVDVAELQRLVGEATRTWHEDLSDAARAEHGEESASQLMSRWGSGFPEAYKESFQARVGVADVRQAEDLPEDGAPRLNLYHAPGEPAGERRLKVYSRGPLSLTGVLPIFTDMGVEVTDERPYELSAADGGRVHIYDFGLRAADEDAWTRGRDGSRRRFEEAFSAVWSGQAESDGFNALVLKAGLEWREIVILRAVAKYQRQTGTPFTQSYVEGTLAAHPHIAGMLVELFLTRFDPDRFGGEAEGARKEAEEAVTAKIMAALDDVASLDHDRIIRSFLGVIQATLRTNYFQTPRPGEDGVVPDYKPTVCFKLDPKRVPGLPAPRPMFEIWVYSPRVEGVHLRFGKVARGGLRWSDRREDFRTEILGLVKAQMVKNAVIVPTGSKGGFFPKHLPDPSVDRDAWLAEGIASYKLFISSLLDVTDNRVGAGIVPPERVVRHDPDDPYLVVAADKGTASFSDIANGVAQSYGFWLDDAFASGGSAGYDHKGMGITARGAWESVKRHFRELGTDCQTQEFTAVGIGDMSGDVFGNGMLLSPVTRLVCAFDHRHIFLDPTPDAATSFAERRRMFDLPRSSWADYDTSLISEGGGVFPRSAKSIPVSPQVRAALGIEGDVEQMTPAELMHAALLAPVDLLWNGGIGTYVKASTENNAEIGDRANDAIRVNGSELRCKVIGEGGNLGASQLGRIEAAMAGVRVNTDAIDNSAGVDTSDHEVNIKILLTGLTREGDMTLKQRNALLASMTDDVARMVLRDNYEQNVLLGNARSQRSLMLTVHERFIHWLEERGELDRPLEFLPDDADIARRRAAGAGLESPEFCVLVAYAKLALKADLLASSLPDDPWFERTLADYFPPAIREGYAAHLSSHPLKREIIVNAVANSVINRGGITFVYRALEETGAAPEQIAAAFVVAREVFGLRDFVARVEELDNVVSTETQTRMYLEFRRLLDRAARWFLQRRPGHLDISAEIDKFSGPVQGLSGRVADLLKGSEQERLRRDAAELTEQGVPEDLALRSAGLLDLFSALDIVELAEERREDVDTVAATYFAVSEHFGVDDMLERVGELPREDRWDALARAAMRDDLYGVLESLTQSVVSSTDAGQDGPARLAAWLDSNSAAMDRTRSALSGITSLEHAGIAPLSVALRTLRGVARSGGGNA